MDTSTFTEGMMKGPEGEILRFFYDSAKNEPATNAEGRAIFDTVLMLDIITPGQKSSVPCVEVERSWSPQSLKAMQLTNPSKRTHYYHRFEEQVERFKRQEGEHDMGGTPLKMWPRADRGLIATLMAANVYTVEQLAGISDSHLDIIGMGARDLREQAKEFLKVAEGSSDSSALTAKVADLTVENTRLADALALANAQATDFQKRLLALEGAAPKVPDSVFKDI